MADLETSQTVTESATSPRWENWSGRQTATPAQILRPESEADFVAAVETAGREGWSVRAVGASHSHSRIAAPDGLLIETDHWQGLVDDPAEGRKTAEGDPVVTARSGTRIFQLGEPLYQRGLALINQGDIDKQSIAGAIATGTHGTGPALGSFSTAVVGVRLVLAGGEVVRCDSTTEPELFDLARQSLGGVGLVTEVDLRVRARYLLHERQWIATMDEVMPRIDELVADTRHFEYFWVPDRDLFACKSLTEVPAANDPAADGASGGSSEGESPEPEQLAKRERRGWSHRIISSIRDDKHTEMEYSVPAHHGPACFSELRDMIKSRFPELQWPLEYRTVAADDLMISAASDRETVTISAHQDITLDDRPLFTACEEIFRRYEGRPHWGKVHYQTGAELAELYPRYRQWWDRRDRYDPNGMFVTEDLARLRP